MFRTLCLKQRKFRPFFKAYIFLLLINCLYSLNGIASPPLEFKEEAEEELYQQGRTHQTEKKFKDAIDCYQPLAKKKYVKAQHNLAFCHFELGNEMEAYRWYSSASNQEFEPSRRNLDRMNLLCLLLPDELLSHVASCLGLKHLSHFGRLSRRAHRVFRGLITTTDFLSSEHPFAIDFFSIFRDVEFDPKPKAIRLGFLAKAEEGSLEIHFRDPKHLRAIVEETPQVEAKQIVYFVQDDKVKDGHELVPTEGELKRKYFISVRADSPLNPKGKATLPLRTIFPPRTNVNSLSLNVKGGFCCAPLNAYENAHVLATMIETFDEHLYKTRTADANQLFKDRKTSRLQFPQYFPDFFELCPEACIVTTSALEVKQTDHVSANQPLIYISPSIATLEELRLTLPEFSHSTICYIDPHCSQSGVYCLGPLYLQKGFELFTESNFSMTGKIFLPDHSLTITSKESIWTMGVQVLFGGNMTISAKEHIDQPISTPLQKPENMPEEHWKGFLEFWGVSQT